MYRVSCALRMRVLCLTMIPDGGAMTPALASLGYTPYSLKSSFQQGHASTHPVEWSAMLEGKKAYNKKLFTDYDAMVGPPGAMLYDAILRECPSYTKVILVEEPNKAQWAADYEQCISHLRKVSGRASKNKISVAFNNMLDKMVVRGDQVGIAGVPASVKDYSFKKQTTPNMSDADKLKRALDSLSATSNNKHKHADNSSGSIHNRNAAEENAKGPEEQPTTNTEEEEEGEDEKVEAPPLSPRAVALQHYEESVRLSVPASRLLVYRHGDGWGPLCAFLDKPEPSQPFPPYDDGLHVLNNVQERIRRAQTILYVLMGLVALYTSLSVLPYLGVARAYMAGIYQDYLVAFGKDDEGVPKKKNAAATTTTTTTITVSPSAAFENEWARRGGRVVESITK